MTLLAQLSDPHLRLDDDGASAAALQRGVAAVNRLRPAPDAVLISGDLANTPVAAEYERLFELIEPLAAPVHVLTGNHDDTALVHRHFPLGDATTGDYRYVTEVGDLRLVGVDTTVSGSEAGAFGTERLAWLESVLDAAVDSPTILAMHHPPVAIGIDAMDKIRIAEADGLALTDSLVSRPQVRSVVCGHVHRAAVARVGDCPVFACPSNHLAVPLEIGAAGDPEEIELVAEPPAFALHVLLGDGQLVSHLQPITSD